MKTNNKNTPHPEKTGKVPSSGVISETYKEEVNPQDELGNTSNNPKDPEEPQGAEENDFDSYPLEESDTSADVETEPFMDDDDDDEYDPSVNDDEFFK